MQCVVPAVFTDADEARDLIGLKPHQFFHHCLKLSVQQRGWKIIVLNQCDLANRVSCSTGASMLLTTSIRLMPIFSSVDDSLQDGQLGMSTTDTMVSSLMVTHLEQRYCSTI